MTSEANERPKKGKRCRYGYGGVEKKDFGGGNQRVMKGKGETHGNGGRRRQGGWRWWEEGFKKYIYKGAFKKNLSFLRKNDISFICAP